MQKKSSLLLLLIVLMSVLSCKSKGLRVQYCEKCENFIGHDFFDVYTSGNLNGLLISDWSPKSEFEQGNVGGLSDLIFYDAKLNDSQKFRLEIDFNTLACNLYRWHSDNSWKELEINESLSEIFYFKDEMGKRFINGYLRSASSGVTRTVVFSVGENNKDGFLIREYK